MKRNVVALRGLAAACGVLATACSGDDTTPAVPLDASSEAPTVSSDASGADAGPDTCADAASPPATLACTGLYASFATKELSPNALAYTPSSFLWSDGAQKQRWIELPPGSKIDISNPDEWTFPVGTKVFKEFRVNGQRVETRMFQKQKADFWLYATYAWNSDDSAATINYGGPVPVGNDGGTWTIPTNDDCNECHRGRQDRILGFEQVSLGLPGAQGLTLAQLAAQDLVTPAPANVSLTIGDDGTGLDALALGWIHINCGVTCHNSNPGAAGYGAGMLLRLDPTQLDGTTPGASTWDVLHTTPNAPCVSTGFVGQERIVPGDPADSVVYQLINERGAVQMPPIASNVVDTTDVAVVRAWIASMGSDGGTASDGGPELDGGTDGGRHRDGGMGFEGGVRDSGAKDAGDATVPEDAGTDASDDAGEDAGNDAGAGSSDDAGNDSASN